MREILFHGQMEAGKWVYGGRAKVEDFGRNVFLSREESQQALVKGDGGK